MREPEFNDARLVTVYDAECPWSRDDDFFLAVVDETPGARVLDLGCGTGRLTLAIAGSSHVVTGVDPARASLDAARAKPGGERVTWIEGTSAALGERTFDVAVMTSHVAQFLVDHREWSDALADLKRALVPGGRLVFDTRDPRARAWDSWNPVDSRRQVGLPDGSTVEIQTEVTAVRDGTVTFTRHYRFPGRATSVGELTSTATLRFRPEADVRRSLESAGFTIEAVYGGWSREPVGAGAGELLVIARA